MADHQAPPSLGFSRQEHWSGLPFPPPMCESEVAQSCPTLCDPMDCTLPGSSVHGIFQARGLEWGAIAFSESRVRWVQNKDIRGTSKLESSLSRAFYNLPLKCHKKHHTRKNTVCKPSASKLHTFLKQSWMKISCSSMSCMIGEIIQPLSLLFCICKRRNCDNDADFMKWLRSWQWNDLFK